MCGVMTPTVMVADGRPAAGTQARPVSTGPGAPFVTAVRERGRFGRELLVSPVPPTMCSHDCRYCPTGPARQLTLERTEFFPLPWLLSQIESWAGVHGAPDGIWYECGGDPALYLRLGELTCCLRCMMPNVRIGVRCNGALLGDGAVRRELG
ncbi:hypothetical protein EG831_08900, partial [bacterium]|nr:hypothetical protein [bacterium]